MSAGFGFSVGDFIAALGLVRDVIDALQDSGFARIKYRQLLRQLYSLESALQQVNRLELDDVESLDGIDRTAETSALREAAAQCQGSIEEFFKRIRQYSPYLQDQGQAKRPWSLKPALRKVQWALCHKDDISKLQADLMGHTESINLLLATIQLQNSRIESSKQGTRHRALTRKIQGSFSACMKKLSAVFDVVNEGVRQSRYLFELTTNVIETNVRIFQIVLSIQHHILSIPGQIERQQPVFLIDALGRSSPFHLEFVRSAKALVAVLEANFENYGSAADKIRRSEFVIEDAATKRDIDLEMDWELCFQPGQKTLMSMTFDRPLEDDVLCPRCSTTCEGQPDADIDCTNCGMTFRRVVDMVGPEDTEEAHEPFPTSFGPTLLPTPRKNLKRLRDAEEDELGLFRKVRIRTLLPLTVSEDVVEMGMDSSKEPPLYPEWRPNTIKDIKDIIFKEESSIKLHYQKLLMLKHKQRKLLREALQGRSKRKVLPNAKRLARLEGMLEGLRHTHREPSQISGTTVQTHWERHREQEIIRLARIEGMLEGLSHPHREPSHISGPTVQPSSVDHGQAALFRQIN